MEGSQGVGPGLPIAHVSEILARHDFPIDLGSAMSVAANNATRAADGKAADLLSRLQQGRDFAGAVNGSEGFEMFQGQHDPHKFVMVERWTSVEVHQAHFEKNVKDSGILESAGAPMAEPFPAPHESHVVLR
jgi:quinol monooxygenase YgiN